AERAFATAWSGVPISTGDLDLNQPWTAQGIEPGTYALVWGVNVFHLARRLDDVLVAAPPPARGLAWDRRGRPPVRDGDGRGRAAVPAPRRVPRRGPRSGRTTDRRLPDRRRLVRGAPARGLHGGRDRPRHRPPAALPP